MKEWLSRLVADKAGIPDELRAGFVWTSLLYTIIWIVYLACGNLSRWPGDVLEFVSGWSGLVIAFGLGAKARRDN